MRGRIFPCKHEDNYVIRISVIHRVTQHPSQKSWLRSTFKSDESKPVTNATKLNFKITAVKHRFSMPYMLLVFRPRPREKIVIVFTELSGWHRMKCGANRGSQPASGLPQCFFLEFLSKTVQPSKLSEVEALLAILKMKLRVTSPGIDLQCSF